MSARNRGFTLIEILVVVTIIAALMGMVVLLYGPANKTKNETITTTRIQAIQTALEALRSHQVLGQYPPAEMAALRGPKGEPVGQQVGTPNRTNLGIETVWVAIHMNVVDISIDEKDDWIANTDGDTMLQNPTRSAKTDLYEYVDAWGNPFAYFSVREYNTWAKDGQAIVMADGSTEIAKPWVSEKTGLAVRRDSFQLFSAGPDGKFNTKDDVKGW